MSYTKQQYLHPLNKLGDVLKITKEDGYIADFIDYIGFYGKWKKTDWYYLFMSDNGREAYVDNISLIAENTSSGRIYIYGLYAYAGRVVRLFRADQMTMGKDFVMKIDLYGKGILLANKENLRGTLEKIRTKFFGMEEIKITRTDYTCDCSKYNFRKTNSLRVKIKGKFYTKDELSYYGFGKKGKNRFLRYYDKKAEILKRGTQFLYPEYFGYSEIMRYELQVNGSALDDVYRVMNVDQIKDYANFGIYIPKNNKSHKKLLDDDILEETLANIKKMYCLGMKDNIEKIKLFLGFEHKLG
ncbi:MAG: hypothetical protein DLD55_02960 [candidate division SR1 bacterium]|nr:MAG: hypothetical protein DLD55_02960 [candidate division SR1 bacterium]